jgi:hypothetical protein
MITGPIATQSREGLFAACVADFFVARLAQHLPMAVHPITVEWHDQCSLSALASENRMSDPSNRLRNIYPFSQTVSFCI